MCSGRDLRDQELELATVDVEPTNDVGVLHRVNLNPLVMARAGVNEARLCELEALDGSLWPLGVTGVPRLSPPHEGRIGVVATRRQDMTRDGSVVPESPR